MKVFLEREVKLAPPESLDLESLGGTRAPARSFDSTYYDTAERDLLRRGVTLRRRIERRKGAWQLKVPSGKARVELEFADAESPPGEATELLLALTRRAPLEAVARLKTRRETIRVDRDGVHVADVVRDAVTVLDGEEVVGAFDEVEIELADGAEDDLELLERALREAGATDAGGPSKLARALGVPPGAVNGGPPPEESPAGDPPAGAARPGRASSCCTIRARAPASIPRTCTSPAWPRAGCAPSSAPGRICSTAQWADEVRDELKWVGGTLGVVRDQDVLIERLRAEADELERGRSRRARRRCSPRSTPSARRPRAEFPATLDSDRYLALLDRLETDPPLRDDTDATLTEIWRREYRRTRKALRALERRLARRRAARGADPRQARALRGGARGPELGKKGAAFVEAAKELQDVLGAHQDAVVGEEVLRRLAPELPGAALAMGRLVDRERARRADARAPPGRRAWRELARRAKALGA